MQLFRITVVRMLPKPDYEDESGSTISEEETPLEPIPDYDVVEVNSILHLHDAEITVPIPPKDYNVRSSYPYRMVRSKSSQQLRRFPSTSTNTDSTLIDEYTTRSEFNYSLPRSYSVRPSLTTTGRNAMEHNERVVYSTNTFSGAFPYSGRKRSSLGNFNIAGWENDWTTLSTARALVTWRGSNAAELNVNKGEMLEVLEKRNVWWRCKNANNETGWVPAEFLLRL
uniref:SH3 domain-containing protein n=1 Tax=Parascaris univalens TaxID=6257 RepID=A0A915BRF1_PARUN